MTSHIVRIDDVNVAFGGIIALGGVSFAVPKGSIFGLIGPNGAGKTTLFNCLSRVYTPDRGAIEFDGQPLLSVPPYRISGLGIGRTFQNLAMFRDLSVYDNVRIGCHSAFPSTVVSDILGLPQSWRNERSIKQRALEMIDYLGLGPVMHTRAGDLPFGTQKRIELARALAMRPKLLLLDEPACGLNHEEVASLGTLIRRIRSELELTVLLVEHHMQLVMSVCERIVALNFGRKLAEGTPAEIRSNADVVAAYLGTQEHA